MTMNHSSFLESGELAYERRVIAVCGRVNSILECRKIRDGNAKNRCIEPRCSFYELLSLVCACEHGIF